MATESAATWKPTISATESTMSCNIERADESDHPVWSRCPASAGSPGALIATLWGTDDAAPDRVGSRDAERRRGSGRPDQARA
ncbi:hypothetical protein GCM10023340_06740 [Nocardioides marinquilinus]|uniref:Uncharacterized protein n=1 Tax=Nocardioides marinquilinus TaxID=1210400 RepID=A0ABP9P979_9ACTN